MNSFEFALFLHKDYCEFYDKRYSDNYYKEKMCRNCFTNKLKIFSVKDKSGFRKFYPNYKNCHKNYMIEDALDGIWMTNGEII
jgi:hypothetical protein